MTKKWGPITWYFIHSLYSKLSQEKFNIHYLKINNLVHSIIKLLPCDYCKNHALEYLSKHKFSIHEKNVVYQRNFFYTFHNEVNKELHKPIFTNFEMYTNSNLNSITKQFIQIFSANIYNVRSLGVNFHRRLLNKHIIETLKQVFS